MNRQQKLRRLSRLYVSALGKYCLPSDREAVLEEAYELGRAAIAAGFGILDMARVHLEVREKLLRADVDGKNRVLITRLAGAFFLQTLSPFEATHRGFSETNAELLKSNRKLAAEIVERQRVETALRVSEQRYTTLVETAQDVIFSLKRDGRIESLNPAFEVITGWPRKAWLGQSFVGLLHQEDAAEAMKNFTAVVRGGPPEHWEYRVRKANGEYATGEFTQVREMCDGRCIGVFGIGRDITVRKRAEDALKRLSSKILQAQEEERRRISRELHDEVGQSLTAVSVMLATLRSNGAVKSEHLARTIAGTQRLLEGTMETVHRFARELRPAMLDELGLLPALRSHLKSFSEHTGLRVRLDADPVAETLNGNQKTAVFRIAQESLTNVAKHARASRVNISIRRAGEGIRMEIADNGRSFQVDPGTAARQKQRLGLLGMQERVRLVNGQFHIKPQLGRGTTVLVTIPFQEQVAQE